MKRTIVALLVVLLAGCADPPDNEPDDSPMTQPAEGSDDAGGPPPAAVPVTTTDVSFEGRLGTQVCTFGPIRHQCDGAPGENTFVEIGTYAAPLWINGTAGYAEDPAAPPRIDIFLLADRGDGYRWDPDVDPVATGAAPQSFAWNVSAYADVPLALFVFGSHTQYVDPVGVSIVPATPFRVDVAVVHAAAAA